MASARSVRNIADARLIRFLIAISVSIIVVEDHKIYIVIGHHGQYSDYSEYPICWRATKEEAEAIVDLCRQQKSEFKDKFGDDDWSDAAELYKSTQMLDKQFHAGYNETDYFIWVVFDTPSIGEVIRSRDPRKPKPQPKTKRRTMPQPDHWSDDWDE